MNVDLAPASQQDRATIAALLQLYAYDLSDLLALDIGDDGRFRTPSLDAYWTDSRCHPFLLRVDGALAGFALVQERSRLTGDPSVRDMAEFFVLRRHRGRGVGERAATALFDRFRGRWEVRERKDNGPAISFWRRVIDRYTRNMPGRFVEETLDDERWRGCVQRFEAR